MSCRAFIGAFGAVALLGASAAAQVNFNRACPGEGVSLSGQDSPYVIYVGDVSASYRVCTTTAVLNSRRRVVVDGAAIPFVLSPAKCLDVSGRDIKVESDVPPTAKLTFFYCRLER